MSEKRQCQRCGCDLKAREVLACHVCVAELIEGEAHDLKENTELFNELKATQEDRNTARGELKKATAELTAIREALDFAGVEHSGNGLATRVRMLADHKVDLQHGQVKRVLRIKELEAEREILMKEAQTMASAINAATQMLEKADGDVLRMEVQRVSAIGK